jgi:hypothetical protein
MECVLAGGVVPQHGYCPLDWGPTPLERVWHVENTVWSSVAIAVAQGIYDEDAYEQLPILADVLEESGCTNAGLLEHCRDGSAHPCSGCWVVDLLLGKAVESVSAYQLKPSIEERWLNSIRKL